MASLPQPDAVRPALTRTTTGIPNGTPAPPVTAQPVRSDGTAAADVVLELADGTAFRGISFGAEGKSIAGECVFQTGASFFTLFSRFSLNLLLQEWSDTPSR